MAATDTKFKINYYTLRDFETLKPVSVSYTHLTLPTNREV